MFDLGVQELIVIFVVALLVFGPKRLPELARNMGKGVAHLKKALFDMKQEINKEAGIDLGDDMKPEFPDWKKHALEQIYGKEGFPEAGGSQQGVNTQDKADGSPEADNVEGAGKAEEAEGAPQVHGDDIEGSEPRKGQPS